MKQYGPSGDILQNIPNIDRVRRSLFRFQRPFELLRLFLQNFDPLAEHRRPTIADRENDYQKKRRMVVGAISPERVDYFADGKCFARTFSLLLFFSVRVCLAIFQVFRGSSDAEFLFIGLWSHGYTTSSRPSFF